MRSLVRFFGEEAQTRLVEVHSCEWGADEWSRGCPVNLLGVGNAVRHGAAMRAPLLNGRLHWASTQAAPAFVGYMEGAVRAGEAAAAAVLATTPAPDERAWGWSGTGARDGGAPPR